MADDVLHLIPEKRTYLQASFYAEYVQPRNETSPAGSRSIHPSDIESENAFAWIELQVQWLSVLRRWTCASFISRGMACIMELMRWREGYQT